MASRRLVDAGIWAADIAPILREKNGAEHALFYVYALTSPHSNLLGIYFLPELYASQDLGGRPVRSILTSITFLSRRALIDYDAEAKVIWVPRLLQAQMIDGEPQLKRALAEVESLPQTALFTKLYGLLSPRLSQRLSSDSTPIGIKTLWGQMGELLKSRAAGPALQTGPLPDQTVPNGESPIESPILSGDAVAAKQRIDDFIKSGMKTVPS